MSSLTVRTSTGAVLALVLAGCGAAGPEQTGDDAYVKEEAVCIDVPACDAAPPDPGPRQSWSHWRSAVATKLGSPHHRGRDLVLREDDEQWIIAKVAYGLTDKDLEDEVVDVWLLRGCGDAWEKLGSTRTTTDEAPHATVEGVPDSGGRVYFPIPEGARLGIGRHRVRLVVKGDLSATELFVEVLPDGARVFVSDVDGTLTTNEVAEFGDLLVGELPETHDNAPDALQELAAKGYRPIYLTARPEQLVQRTRDFLAVRGFPPGIIHTTTGLTGAFGSAAAKFKKNELAALAERGFVPDWAFGNTASDGQAYEAAGIEPADHRVFYRFDDPLGGRRIDDYGELFEDLDAESDVCN